MGNKGDFSGFSGEKLAFSPNGAYFAWGFGADRHENLSILHKWPFCMIFTQPEIMR